MSLTQLNIRDVTVTTQSGEKIKNRQRQEWDSNPGLAEETYHCTTTLLVKQFGNKYYILQI
jgi:hypothetical protein